MKNFRDLGLSEKSLNVIKLKGFEEPTEIQQLTIPLLLEDKIDIIAQAQTGTGKTAAFALPLIEKIEPYSKKPKAIILAPTRELVIQICEEINSLKGDKQLSIASIYGGQSIEMQLNQLKRGVSIVVGTPGRIQDHMRRKTLHLDNIKYFVLDEADEMLNMGFIEDIETIFEATPKDKRVLLFSATIPTRIKNLAEKYMGKYTHLKSKTKLTTNLTDQIYFEVLHSDKFEALCRIIDIETFFYGIIFCRTKVDADQIVGALIDRGYSADALHGDISQFQREKILNKFRKKQTSILVATDVAARGIDVENLSHVINYSIPQNPESYVHRIGRTGRAGKEGTAITFITPSEFRKLGFIKKIADVDIRRENVPEVKDIIEAKQTKIKTDIEKIIENKEHEKFKKWADIILSSKPPLDVLAATLKYTLGQTIDESNYKELTPLKSKNRGKTLIEEEGKTRLFIAKGKNTNTSKKSLVEFIVKKAGTPENLINNIEIHENFSFIDVPFAEAEIILNKFKQFKKGRKSIVEKAKVKSFKHKNKN